MPPIPAEQRSRFDGGGAFASSNDPLLTPADAGIYLSGVPPSTLQWWRSIGRGPDYIKVGRRVCYRRSALDAFLAAGVRTPEPA